MPRENRHEQVSRCRAEKSGNDGGGAQRLIQPVTKHERDHQAYRRGTFAIQSGHGVIRPRGSREIRLHLKRRKGGTGPNPGVVEKYR
jgi:hypothetical protein